MDMSAVVPQLSAHFTNMDHVKCMRGPPRRSWYDSQLTENMIAVDIYCKWMSERHLLVSVAVFNPWPSVFLGQPTIETDLLHWKCIWKHVRLYYVQKYGFWELLCLDFHSNVVFIWLQRKIKWQAVLRFETYFFVLSQMPNKKDCRY